MSKAMLTEDEYIAELNAHLRKHEYFEAGMEFAANPKGAIGKNISGYSVSGPPSRIGVFAKVANQVSEIYDLKI